MTIGIYSLYWEDQDLVYIGQSQNLERRYKDHINSLQNGTHNNYKVQDTFNKYGEPKFIVLEVCKIADIYTKEILWTEEFNSLHGLNGLNIVEPGTSSSGWGTNAANARYSRIQILRVFSMLYKTTLKYSTISLKSKVPIHIINQIKNGLIHTWLCNDYTTKYRLMQLRPKNYPKTKIEESTLVSSTGEIHILTSIKDFCLSIPELAINIKTSSAAIGKVLLNKKKSYKGWKTPTF